ncbi:MAG: sigma 54-interacting transcriptional regulator [Syntrophomonas sp.]|nr:sigma 54-interacting transcriptional regulator [Syntrophomonas sp.]
MEGERVDIKDLVDPSFLQDFQDNFALCVGVSSLTEDVKGNALTQSSYFTECCTNIIRTSEIGLQRCRLCDMRGGEEAARTGKPAVYKCHAGLTDFAAPIMLEGIQIGAIFGGQILTEPPNEQRFRKIAREIGVDSDKFMAAIKKVPIVPEESIQAAARVLFSVANTFSKMAYQTLMLQERNRELVLANCRMNNIFKTMSDGVLIIDEDGIVKKVNKITEHIFGKPASELVLNSIQELVGAKAPCSEKILQRHEVYNDIEIIIDTNAGRIHCLSSGSPIMDNEGIASGGVITLRPMEKVQKLINRFSGAQAAFGFDDIIGQSPAFLKTIKVASMAAASMTNVLLEGESGTGKEVFAQAIHNNSVRCKGPFVAINCGAIPRELVGSELFGYTDGAFTGAKRGGRPGKFELASGGTLFLDEIGDMPLDQQVALLRVLQERKITRIGDDKVMPVDVRIICASNKDLADEVKKGNFRQDLYYRLNVVSIKIPSLRQRQEDILLLFDYMLDHIGHEWDSKVKYIDPEVMWLLKDYSWPGNVRELQNVVERIISIADGDVVRLEHLPESILNNTDKIDEVPPLSHLIDMEDIRENRKHLFAEKEYQRITSLLTQFGGNVSQVAREMGVARSTLYRKMQRFNTPN